MNAAQSPPTITDPETVRQWAAYEYASTRARLQYAAFPTSAGRLGVLAWCDCGRRTMHHDGVCQHCRDAR